jgi:hypothetical protein
MTTKQTQKDNQYAIENNTNNVYLYNAQIQIIQVAMKRIKHIVLLLALISTLKQFL